jgi:hypothetical protein
MEKIVVVFDEADPKKHSIRYNAKGGDAAIESIYVKRSHLPKDYPQKIKITIEEV